MKRTFVFLACAGALLLAGCTSESSLPNPTGKGVVRAIHAIPGATDVTFKIEERSLGNLDYKQSSPPARYDDFEYNFNFDIFVPDSLDPVRVTTVTQKIDADREYVFALSGTIDTPTVTTWSTDLRQWDGTETVFEARFAHLSASLGDIDVYYDDPANPPSAANLVATLSPGDIADIADFEAGTYVITVTAAGDPNRVPVYTSPELNYNAQESSVVSIFDGNENDTAPYIVGISATSGLFIRLPDVNVPPAVRFVHGALTLGPVDIYDDELLTSQVTSNVALGTSTGDFTRGIDATTYYFTPAGSTATTLFNSAPITQLAGTTAEFYLIGDTDEWQALFLSQNRAAVSTGAKISIINASVNHPSFDLYIKERDDPLVEEDLTSFPRILFSLSSPQLQRVAGGYDIYLTEPGTKNELAGPFQIDVALGDVVFLLAVDNVDPSIVDIADVSIP
jgi:hypothetical protein